jgi:hypothetical protein
LRAFSSLFNKDLASFLILESLSIVVKVCFLLLISFCQDLFKS